MAETITKFKHVGIDRIGLGTMESSETVDRGTICVFNTSGKVQQINDTSDWKFAGIARYSAGDTDEPSIIELSYGTPFFYPYTGAAQLDVGEAAYASGLGTIAKSSTNSVYVGIICDVEVGVGWWIDPLYPQNLGTTAGSDDWNRDAGTSSVRPKNAGDAIQTDDPSSQTEILDLDDNIITSDGTNTNIDVIIKPKGTGSVSVTGTTNYENNIADDDDIPNKKWIDDNKAPSEGWAQVTTNASGEVTITGMDSTGIIIAIGAESGADVSYVIAGTDKFTVYDSSDTALNTKKVNYLVLDKTTS